MLYERNLNQWKILYSLISGLLLGLSYYYMLFPLAWFALVPLLFVILSEPPSRALKYGFLAGLIQAVVMYFWMAKVISSYMGEVHPLGVFFLFSISIFYAALYPTLFSWLVSFISRSIPKYSLIHILTGTIVWVGLELFKDKIFGNSFPWFSYPIAISQAKVLPLIGIVSLGSVYILSAILVLVNFFLVYYLIRRKRFFLFVAIGLFLLNISIGTLLSRSKQALPGDETIKVALLSENIAADMRWNDQTGDSLVNIFFALNKEAAKLNPDLIVWSETAVPWTYSENDPFLENIFSVRTNSYQLIGMLQKGHSEEEVYNSALLFDGDGILTGQYDKIDLLSALEKPLFPGLSKAKLSFLAEGLMDNILPGSQRNILQTPLGKFGVMICNESLLPGATRELKRKGINLLVVMSNDGWFAGTQVVQHHFYFNRFRAMENHIPVIVNSNMGISGFIDANGKIIAQKKSDLSFILNTKLHFNPGTK